MTNDPYIDSGYISLIKAGEQLCGDRVEIVHAIGGG